MPLCKRIIPCLDVTEGRVVKGINFQGLRDVGDPVELALRYQDQGADELVFLDISASIQGRDTMRELVKDIAKVLMIPFTVGGGVSSLENALALLQCGADKVSVNTAAVERPDLISEIAQTCGSQCCVLAIDAKRFTQLTNDTNEEKGWEVLTHGGRRQTEKNAVEWAKIATELGAGEILLTSWDKDGTRSGFDLPLTRAISEAVSVPVIASGGASQLSDFVDVFTTGKADAALAASIFHDGEWTVLALKQALIEKGMSIRPC